MHLRVFRCSETSLDGFGTNLLIGFSEIYILVREILKENYETLVWNASRSRGIGGRFAASKPCTAGSSNAENHNGRGVTALDLATLGLFWQLGMLSGKVVIAKKYRTG